MNCGAGLKILFMYMIVYTCTVSVQVIKECQIGWEEGRVHGCTCTCV